MKAFRFFKNIVKQIVIGISYFYFARFQRKSVARNRRIKSLAETNEHVFFGYYDKTPFDESESKVLATRVPLIHEQDLSKARVGYYSLEDGGSWNEIATTNTWCWQLGTRLQWIGRKNDRVMFNDYIDGKYVSVLYDIVEKKNITIFNMPVYDVNESGTEAITLDFSRLHRLRPGYGYMNREDTTLHDKAPERSGVWSVNLQNGATRLVLSIADIVAIEPKPSMKNAEHYFNHLKFNPSGERFLLFHCWVAEGKRYNRIFTCNRNGSDLYPLVNNEYASHYTWIDDEQLLIYAGHPDGVFFRLYSDKKECRLIIGREQLLEDGHPSFNPRKCDSLLLDTYPVFFPVQKLYLFDVTTNKKEILGSFYSSKIYRGSQRCDLHPRWSPSGKLIAFDSVFMGDKRGIHLLQL